MGCEIECLTTVKFEKAGVFETIHCDKVAHGPVHSVCLRFAKFTEWAVLVGLNKATKKRGLEYHLIEFESDIECYLTEPKFDDRKS